MADYDAMGTKRVWCIQRLTFLFPWCTHTCIDYNVV